jgi:hypothetical protein
VAAQRMRNLIKIQSVVRSYQAVKKKRQIKEEKMGQLFSNSFRFLCKH